MFVWVPFAVQVPPSSASLVLVPATICKPPEMRRVFWGGGGEFGKYLGRVVSALLCLLYKYDLLRLDQTPDVAICFFVRQLLSFAQECYITPFNDSWEIQRPALVLISLLNYRIYSLAGGVFFHCSLLVEMDAFLRNIAEMKPRRELEREARSEGSTQERTQEHMCMKIIIIIIIILNE